MVGCGPAGLGRKRWEELRNCRAPRRAELTHQYECVALLDWSDAFRDQQLMVLLARQKCCTQPCTLEPLLHCCPTRVKAGCFCAEPTRRFLGHQSLEKKDITDITQDNVYLPCTLNSNRLCSDSYISPSAFCLREPQACPLAFGLPGWP